ncbi:MAG: MarR family transcriptional regulator [Promethearchaeota archaeon]
MTSTPLPDHSNSLTKSKAEALGQFSIIKDTIETFIGSPPLDYYSKMNFTTIPLELTNPRFGVIEYKNNTNQYILELSEQLLTQYKKYLDPILWREAYLLHLPFTIRQVPQAADLGLYCYYQHALKTKKQRHRFLQIWESVSPQIEYHAYRYYPTAGFIFFDNVVDGSFLRMAKDWFNPFSQLSNPMVSDTFTANLERWMFNYQRPITPLELKVLRGLYDCLDCSQIELAEKLKLRQPTVSTVIKRLTEKHLLRLSVFENFPVIGLRPQAIHIEMNESITNEKLKKLVHRIRYTLSLIEFDKHLLTYFLIPIERISRFRQWIKQLARAGDVSLPKIRTISERIQSWNFDLFDIKTQNWQIDVEMVIDSFERLVREDLTWHLPPLNSIKFESHSKFQSIKLQPEDFIYMSRATDAYLATNKAKFYEAYEARVAGYEESRHMAYRRRIQFLEEQNLLSPPIGFGAIHLGLNTSINLFLETSLEESLRILTACQLFPRISGNIHGDGSSTVTILVPDAYAISIYTALTNFFLTQNISAITSVYPSWEGSGWLNRSPVSPTNYDFNYGRWIWVKDTLPYTKF